MKHIPYDSPIFVLVISIIFRLINVFQLSHIWSFKRTTSSWAQLPNLLRSANNSFFVGVENNYGYNIIAIFLCIYTEKVCIIAILKTNFHIKQNM